MACVLRSSTACLPLKQLNSVCDYSIPGWNEYAQDKHAAARDAFLDWVTILVNPE